MDRKFKAEMSSVLSIWALRQLPSGTFVMKFELLPTCDWVPIDESAIGSKDMCAFAQSCCMQDDSDSHVTTNSCMDSETVIFLQHPQTVCLTTRFKHKKQCFGFSKLLSASAPCHVFSSVHTQEPLKWWMLVCDRENTENGEMEKFKMSLKWLFSLNFQSEIHYYFIRPARIFLKRRKTIASSSGGQEKQERPLRYLVPRRRRVLYVCTLLCVSSLLSPSRFV